MLTIAEIAARYPEAGTKRTIQRAAERGELKGTRVGGFGMWLIEPRAVAEWLATRDLPIYTKD